MATAALVGGDQFHGMSSSQREAGQASTPLALQVSMMLRMTADRCAAASEPENSQLQRPTVKPRIARSAIRLSGSSRPS